MCYIKYMYTIHLYYSRSVVQKGLNKPRITFTATQYNILVHIFGYFSVIIFGNFGNFPQKSENTAACSLVTATPKPANQPTPANQRLTVQLSQTTTAILSTTKQ